MLGCLAGMGKAICPEDDATRTLRVSHRAEKRRLASVMEEGTKFDVYEL